MRHGDGRERDSRGAVSVAGQGERAAGGGGGTRSGRQDRSAGEGGEEGGRPEAEDRKERGGPPHSAAGSRVPRGRIRAAAGDPSLGPQSAGGRSSALARVEAP